MWHEGDVIGFGGCGKSKEPGEENNGFNCYLELLVLYFLRVTEGVHLFLSFFLNSSI